MKSTLLLFAIALFMGCSTTKNTKDSMEAKASEAVKSTEMIENGFLAGTIITSTKEGDCPIKIEVTGKESTYFLDPINLDEAFKKEGEKIWFKFNGLRMMNRCEDASPISISEIQKRAE